MFANKLVNVLILEPDAAVAQLLVEALGWRAADFKFTRAATLAEGLARLDAEPCDVALVELNLPARGLQTLNTSTVPELAGRSGSITLTSDAPYGTLAGKAVALEPATGFSFDDVMRPRPR